AFCNRPERRFSSKAGAGNEVTSLSFTEDGSRLAVLTRPAIMEQSSHLISQSRARASLSGNAALIIINKLSKVAGLCKHPRFFNQPNSHRLLPAREQNVLAAQP
ncbi:hypothetical protein NKH14_28625, partial [Mesorhizobium sp. M1380]|uniref:hypothetical protein n=1 Tax=Mesorhizobium sp. M1380 TaxID=2957093 RepID=UPI00333A6962